MSLFKGWYALGTAFVVAMIVLGMLSQCSAAHAAEPPAPAYELVAATYPSDIGHTIHMRSYLDILRVPFRTIEDCEAAKAFAAKTYHPYRDPKTLAVHLLDLQCITNPGAKTP